MADLLDEPIKEKYRQYFVNHPLKFMKDAIDWNSFSLLLLLENPYCNNFPNRRTENSNRDQSKDARPSNIYNKSD